MQRSLKNLNNKLIFLPPDHLHRKTLFCKNQENPSDRISHAWASLRYPVALCPKLTKAQHKKTLIPPFMNNADSKSIKIMYELSRDTNPAP